MGKYNKDVKLKFQAKFLHEGLGLPLPLVAAIQGISRATAYHRYRSISNEIEVYEDVQKPYNEYLSEIEKCKWDGVFKFQICKQKSK